LKCIIINLETAKDRMNFMTKQMNKLSLKFLRINAIAENNLVLSNKKSYWNTWERPLKNTEKACLLSHINAWKSVVKNNRPALILEDDALLSNDTKSVLNAASALQNMDLLSLEVRFRKKLLSKKREKLCFGYHYSKMYQNGSGAAAYILWPSGAKKLITYSKKHAALADALITDCKKLKSFQIEPACALQLDCLPIYGMRSPIEHFSIINSGDNSNRPTYEKRMRLKFLRKRILSQLKKGLQIFFLMQKSEKRTIKLKINKFEYLQE
jgi:glycosyl transferase, family 25